MKKEFIINWLILYLLFYSLTCFVVLFARCSYFYFTKSLTIDFGISKAKTSRANVAIGLFE